jgi:hypothetical protein
MVIFGRDRGLDLEDLAAWGGMKRPWERHGLFKKKIEIPLLLSKKSGPLNDNGHKREAGRVKRNLRI